MRVTINRQKLGLEDLTFGFGSEQQTRGNQTVTITKINAANLPFDETQTLVEVLDTQYPAIEIVASSINDVNTIVANLLNIDLVSLNMSEIKTVADDLQNSGLTYSEDLGSILDPIEVGNNTGSAIEVVATNIADILQAPINAQITITKAEEALASANLADKWASELEDVEVVIGQYSAFHWAMKAAAAVNALVNVYTKTEADARFVPLNNNFTLDLGGLV